MRYIFKPWLISVIVSSVIIIFIAVLFLIGILLRPMIYQTQTSSLIQINKNISANTLAQMLKDKHLFHYPHLFLYLLQIKGLTSHLQAGTYEIQPHENILQFIKKVVAGEVLVKTFSIIEGSNLEQVKYNLSHAPLLNYHPEDLINISGNYLSAEGLLLADTYKYNAGSEAKNLIKLANQELLNYLQQCWKNRTAGLPYKSPYELLIAASIIEKEGSISAERKLISGVIINRLHKHMRLQMDPTVIYALGTTYQGKLTHADLSINSIYNTYRHFGLPPTPIAMVGKNALDAAAHPTITNYLYFVARGDGSHQFSVNYQEQKKAIFDIINPPPATKYDDKLQ